MVNSIPKEWIQVINRDRGLAQHKHISEQHFLYLTRQLKLERMTAKQFYIILISRIQEKPRSEKTIQNTLGGCELNWSKIYGLSREVTVDTYARMFSFKLNHNILYLNKILFRMGKHETKWCSFCNINEETIIHFFAECHISRKLWKNLQTHYQNKIILPDITPQSAYVGFYEITEQCAIINHILLIFKIALYHSRTKRSCNIQYILKQISHVKNIEHEITFLDERKKEFNRRKWVDI